MTLAFRVPILLVLIFRTVECLAEWWYIGMQYVHILVCCKYRLLCDLGVVGGSVEPEPRNNARHKPCFVGGRRTEEEEIAVDQFR